MPPLSFRPFLPHAQRLIALLAIVLMLGCASTRDDFKNGFNEKQFFAPTNFSGEAKLPGNVRRVILLPTSGGDIVPPETAAILEETFATDLQKQLRFEVVRISRIECQRRFGRPDFSSTSVLPHDFMANLARMYAADAAMFIDVTAYRGYRPLVLGVRAKLATTQETRLIWTFDEIFSAENAAVNNSVKKFYGTSDASGIPLDPGASALQSPGKFAAYVAAAAFGTLPLR